MQKQKTLILIAGVAIVLFASALIWKNTRVSNAEVVNYDSSEVKVQKKNRNDKSKDVTIKRTATQTADQLSIEEAKKTAENKMGIALFYPTVEKLYEAIKEAQEQGNEKRADELIAFLLEEYPDFEMPE